MTGKGTRQGIEESREKHARVEGDWECRNHAMGRLPPSDLGWGLSLILRFGWTGSNEVPGKPQYIQRPVGFLCVLSSAVKRIALMCIGSSRVGREGVTGAGNSVPRKVEVAGLLVETQERILESILIMKITNSSKAVGRSRVIS